MSPAAESKESCVYVQVALGRHTCMNGWMDGSNEGWLCLKGMREALKDTFTYYPPSSLTTFITKVSKGPFGVTGLYRLHHSSLTQQIKAGTPSGKQKARQGII